MSTLRSILLHLDASPRSAKRLALAHALAAQHHARGTALYASTPSALSLPYVMGQGSAEMLPMLQQLDVDFRNDAKALFERGAAAAKTPFAWAELSGGAVIPAFARRALLADLMVVGQHDADDPRTLSVPADFVPSVLMASGKPALVVPYVDTGKTFGQEVLLAWKPTRESARAVAAAIPFLLHARRIHLAISDEISDESSDGAADAADTAGALTAYLQLHGVKAPIEHRAAVSAADAGDGLLSLAADVGADLLVMGCYGHSRTRELILGGATRTVLRSMTLPVLMAH